MAEVGHHVFQSYATQTTSSTIATTAYTLGTLTTELDSGGDYIMILDALVGAVGGSGTNNNRRFEIHDNGTLIGGCDARYEPESTTDGEGHHFGIVKRFTKNASGNVTFEIYNPDATTVSVYRCEATFIKLDDLVENTDFLHAVVTDDSLNVSVYTDGASVTIPADAAEKWLVFAYMQMEAGGTLGEDMALKIVDDATDRAVITLEVEDVNEMFCMKTTDGIQGAASTKTVKLQFDAEGGCDMRENEIFALRLGAFKKAEHAVGGSTTITSASTWFELRSLTGFTANHTGAHWMMAGGVFDQAASSNRREQRLMSQIGAASEVLQAGGTGEQLMGSTDITSGEFYPFHLMGEASFTDGDSLNWDCDVQDTVNTTVEVVDSGWVAAGTWELAGTGIQVLRRRRSG